MLARHGHSVDQLQRYLKWFRTGHLSSNGRCFDIGRTVRTALLKFERTGEPFCGDTDPQTAGNGSLMRLAAVPLYFASDPEGAIELAGDSSRTTHGAVVAIDACRYFAGLIIAALNGATKEDLLSPLYSPILGLWKTHILCPEIKAIAEGSYKKQNLHSFKELFKFDFYIFRSLKFEAQLKDTFTKSGVDFTTIHTHEGYIKPLMTLFKKR